MLDLVQNLYLFLSGIHFLTNFASANNLLQCSVCPQEGAIVWL